MKEERMMILNMVNEGRITADEAVSLLNAINTQTEKNSSFDDFAKGVKTKATDFAEKAEPKVKKAAQEIAEKSVEVFNNIKDRIKEKPAEAEKSEGEYVDITVTPEEIIDAPQAEESEAAEQ